MLTYAKRCRPLSESNDYTQKAEGGASKVADTSFGGNAMMEWPKIYTKRWEEGGVYHFRCSDTRRMRVGNAGATTTGSTTRSTTSTPRFISVPMCRSKLRSISGQANMVSQNATTEINYAKANGNDWYTEVLADRLLIQDLLVMMGKSTDGQTVYGKGRCSIATRP